MIRGCGIPLRDTGSSKAPEDGAAKYGQELG